MLDYKNIIIKHCALGMSGRSIAKELGYSKSGVNDFLKLFNESEKISYPLPEGITNYGIYNIIYAADPKVGGRDLSYTLPDFQNIAKKMNNTKNMTLVYQWNAYMNECLANGTKFYQYRQFCELYSKWCDENYETMHFNAIIAQKMEVDFAGKTFEMIDPLTGEFITIVVFVAILPYSQYIYAEGMLSTKEAEWIDVNNHALEFFGGVPAIVVCDNCKQAVTVNKDWIEPCLNKDYAEWADHNHTAILPAKVRKPKFKSSVENAVGILEQGIFHSLAENRYFSIDDFNTDLWDKLDELNRAPFKKKQHNRLYYWEEEHLELMPLPKEPYVYMEQKIAKVSSDYHIRFDNAYYSVDKAYLHKKVLVKSTTTIVKIYSQTGEFICEWPRATRKGQWFTNSEHLPTNYMDFSQWNGPYFISKAMTIGPNTEAVIQRILESRKLEVQTYRLCLGVIGFASKYGKDALEECCQRALKLDKVNYSFIKNSIAAMADKKGTVAYNPEINKKRNKGAYIMDAASIDIEHLLAKSKDLLKEEVCR